MELIYIGPLRNASLYHIQIQNINVDVKESAPIMDVDDLLGPPPSLRPCGHILRARRKSKYKCPVNMSVMRKTQAMNREDQLRRSTGKSFIFILGDFFGMPSGRVSASEWSLSRRCVKQNVNEIML
jgi:hypothetical protein